MYIKKLYHETNYAEIYKSAQDIIGEHGWGHTNQISLKHRAECEDNVWFDGVGSLYNYNSKQFIGTESQFTKWNLQPTNAIRQAIHQLEQSQNFVTGRIRIMKLLPKNGLTVHTDLEVRYHLVLQTNPKSYFCWNDLPISSDVELPVAAVCYHMPQDFHWYYVDTRLKHWVYNGGTEERIHIVVCAT